MKSNPIKVIQLVHALGMGGAETWLMELLRLWNAEPNPMVQMDFLITSGKEGLFDGEARRLGARLFYVPFRKKCLFVFARELRRILRVGQYDAIHDHADFASGWHFLFGGGCLPRIRIAHVHNPFYQLRENYGENSLRRLTSQLGKYLVAKYATNVLGTSRQLLEEYGFFLPPFMHQPKAVVHCGFNLRRFGYEGDILSASESLCAEFGWPKETPILLFAGRLDFSLDINHRYNHKNSTFAVEVFRHCVQREPRLKLIMAGAKEHIQNAFEGHLASLGLSESVRLLGIRHDIERLMLGSRLLLFPSRAEGLGMVAVEAQAAGLPVLASTAVPQECVVIPEIIQFQDLRQPANNWAADVSRWLANPRPRPTVDDPRWRVTSFNILVSARQLQQVYTTGKAGMLNSKNKPASIRSTSSDWPFHINADD